MEEKPYGSRYRLLEIIKNNDLFKQIEKTCSVNIIQNTAVPSANNKNEKSLERYFKDQGIKNILNHDLTAWWPPKCPTWDFICLAKDPEGHVCLVLLEAKAHKGECSHGRKKNGAAAYKKKQKENTVRINNNITTELAKIGGIYCSSYQIANRLAYSVHIAEEFDLPIFLIFYGFINEPQFADAWKDEKDFINYIKNHLKELKIEKESFFNFSNKENACVIIKELSYDLKTN